MLVKLFIYLLLICNTLSIIVFVYIYIAPLRFNLFEPLYGVIYCELHLFSFTTFRKSLSLTAKLKVGAARRTFLVAERGSMVRCRKSGRRGPPPPNG